MILPKVLRSSLKVINPWLEDDQVEEVVKQFTANFPGNGLIENNQALAAFTAGEHHRQRESKNGRQEPDRSNSSTSRTASNNSFTAVCQFKVRILGTEHHIIPDITLFLNGLPVVVIECKSPKVKDAIPEAIDQMMRYSEQRGDKGRRQPAPVLLQPIHRRDLSKPV